MIGWRGKIGLVTVNTNLVMECELLRLAPEGVSVHVARMRGADGNEMARSARGAVEDLAEAGVDVIIYGCTSGSFFRGQLWEDHYRIELEALATRPVVMTASAVTQALRAVGATRLCVATPYTADIDDALTSYLEDLDFEILGVGSGVELGDAPAINRLTAEQIRRLALSSWKPDADALLLSCTAMSVAGVIPVLEADLGRPVIASTPAALWAALIALGVQPRVPGAGRLLAAAGNAA